MTEHTPTFIMKALYRHGPNINVLSSSMNRRMFYRDDWTNDEIILFETMLELSKIFGNNFSHSSAQFQTATRMKQRKFESTRESLIKRGVIKKVNGGFKTPNSYSIQNLVIRNDLTLIYDFRKLPKQDVAHVISDLKNYYSPFI